MIKQLYWGFLREMNTRRKVMELKRNIEGDEPVILIHQPGRVGSMTIYNTTASLSLPLPIYHTHFINLAKLQQRFARYKAQFGSVKQRHLRVARTLAEALEQGSYHGEMKVIITIREPLRRELSTFFLDIEKYYVPNFYRDYASGKYDIEDVKRIFLDCREHLNRDNWFDEEVNEPLGIDVYQEPFDFDNRFNIYKQNNHSALLFRLEDINDVMMPAYQQFFGVAPKEVVNTHISTNGSPEGEIYRDIIKRIKFSKQFLNEIYGTRYMTHFYTEAERSKLIDSWIERT